MNEVLAYATGRRGALRRRGAELGQPEDPAEVRHRGAEARSGWCRSPRARCESGFSMTEPDNAGSDPRSIKTTARRDGDEWVINGHKWFTSNGKRADFLIVMCRTDDPDGPAEQNGKMTQIIVPTDTPGVNIVRGIEVWGRTQRPRRGHLRRRARAGREPARADGLGPPGRPGPPRRRPRLPLHELGRPDVARLRPDGRARHARARSTAACSRRSSSSRASSPTRTSTSRPRA